MARGSILLLIQARYSLHLPRATGQIEVTGQGILTKWQDNTGKDDAVQVAQLEKCFYSPTKPQWNSSTFNKLRTAWLADKSTRRTLPEQSSLPLCPYRLGTFLPHLETPGNKDVSWKNFTQQTSDPKSLFISLGQRISFPTLKHEAAHLEKPLLPI